MVNSTVIEVALKVGALDRINFPFAFRSLLLPLAFVVGSWLFLQFINWKLKARKS